MFRGSRSVWRKQVTEHLSSIFKDFLQLGRIKLRGMQGPFNTELFLSLLKVGRIRTKLKQPHSPTFVLLIIVVLDEIDSFFF
jgi:hypothetical protein